MIKTEDLRIRDPFVLVSGGLYYLYRSTEDEGNTVSVHVSRDLKTWSEPKVIYRLAENSWGYKDLWASEVHFYKGKYYMFLSLMGKNELHGTEISVCDTPDGIFTPLTNVPATPASESCIDGTLYCENGAPYIVYSADWPHKFDALRGRNLGYALNRRPKSPGGQAVQIVQIQRSARFAKPF